MFGRFRLLLSLFLLLPMAGCSTISGAGKDLGGIIDHLPTGGGSRGTITLGDIIKAMRAEQEAEKKKILESNVPVQQLDVLVSQAGAELSQKLPQIPAVKQSETQKILVLSALDNKTGKEDKQGAIASALASLRSTLAGNESVHNSFVVINRSRDDDARLMQEIAGAGNDPSKLAVFDDPLQRKASQTEKVIYNPDDIYILTGEFYMIDNADEVKDHPEQRKITYKLLSHVIHARSSISGLEYSFSKVFKWDETQKKFVPEV
jgi:predicted small secreted protein